MPNELASEPVSSLRRRGFWAAFGVFKREEKSGRQEKEGRVRGCVIRIKERGVGQKVANREQGKKRGGARQQKGPSSPFLYFLLFLLICFFLLSRPMHEAKLKRASLHAQRCAKGPPTEGRNNSRQEERDAKGRVTHTQEGAHQKRKKTPARQRGKWCPHRCVPPLSSRVSAVVGTCDAKKGGGG